LIHFYKRAYRKSEDGFLEKTARGTQMACSPS